MIQPFRKIRTKDKELTQLQNSLARIFLDLLGLEILGGRLIESVLVTTDRVAVDHGLGRDIKGFIVTDRRADGHVWRVLPGTDPSTKLYLDTDRDVTVSLWVF